MISLTAEDTPRTFFLLIRSVLKIITMHVGMVNLEVNDILSVFSVAENKPNPIDNYDYDSKNDKLVRDVSLSSSVSVGILMDRRPLYI